jgi:hypothetical protein
MAIKSAVFAGALALATVLGTMPTQAQSGDGFSLQFQFGEPRYGSRDWDRPARYERTLTPQQVRRILRSRGYEDIRFVDRRGDIYRARAERNGRDFRLVVNAFNGRILDRDRIG